jgi:type VI secretion system FHA domain protein
MARAILPAGWDDDLSGLAQPTPAAPLPAAMPIVPPPQAACVEGGPLSPIAFPPVPPSGVQDPGAPPLPAAPSVHNPSPGRAAADTPILEAFLVGAGMAEARPDNPVSAMREAGAAFRAFVRGLRGVLIARAEIKSAFRIDQTMVRARRNNPLKFAAGDDDALAALLGTGRRTDMTAKEAVEGALTDIRHHELATMAAMQDAVRELLGRLDPARFKAAAGGGLLAAQRRAHAFDLYEAEYKQIQDALGDKLDDAFGRAFAAAYERVTADLRSKEPPA